MTAEARVERLESRFDSLDSAVRSLIKITGETHPIMLKNLRENRLEFQQVGQRFDQQDRKTDALMEATFAGFIRPDEARSETRKDIANLELLIRLVLPNSSN